MVATAVVEELHCVAGVTSTIEPSCSFAVAKKGWASPSKSDGLAGTMDNDSGVFVPGVLLMVHPDGAKQTSKREKRAHLEQVGICCSGSGLGECYLPRRKKDVNYFPNREICYPLVLGVSSRPEKHR